MYQNNSGRNQMSPTLIKVGDFFYDYDLRKNHFFEKSCRKFGYVRKKLYLCCVDKLTVSSSKN